MTIDSRLGRTKPVHDDLGHVGRGAGPRVLRGLDVALKILLVGFLVLVVVNPAYGNLEGKAPVARAVTYPLLAFALPVVWHLLPPQPPGRYPWLVDLLVTVSCFADILGNRLDLYDSLSWFDDVVHLVNTGMLSAAAVLLTLPVGSGLVPVMERAVAAGLSMSLAWEVFEYLSFVMHSPERSMAYQDTLGDLVLGWAGAVVAGTLVHRYLRPRDPSWRASSDW